MMTENENAVKSCGTTYRQSYEMGLSIKSIQQCPHKHFKCP